MIGRCDFIEGSNATFVYNGIDMFETKQGFNSFTPYYIGIRFLASFMPLADDIDEFYKMEQFISSILWLVTRFLDIYTDYDLMFFVMQDSNKVGQVYDY